MYFDIWIQFISIPFNCNGCGNVTKLYLLLNNLYICRLGNSIYHPTISIFNHLTYVCVKFQTNGWKMFVSNKIKKRFSKLHLSCILFHGTLSPWFSWGEVTSSTHWLYNLEQLGPSISFRLRLTHLEFSWMQFTKNWKVILAISIADT